ADQHDLAVLTRHEPLVASAITIASVATRSAEETDRVLDAFASRAAIEQAKGAIMARWRCDADRAWEVLRMTSQQCNVKARELALGFVEHVGGAPGQQSGGPEHQVTVSPAAHDAARMLWVVLTEPAMPNGNALPLVADSMSGHLGTSDTAH
ncbi:MAG TPA: ANTAR domain-containing protein, partial [Pseudonocardiaceae bacterium]|nr:ANTAR domain-containing protein [Pseudonocardiaceae bacterium]